MTKTNGAKPLLEIRDLAVEHNVPIVQNPPLARVLTAIHPALYPLFDAIPPLPRAAGTIGTVSEAAKPIMPSLAWGSMSA